MTTSLEPDLRIGLIGYGSAGRGIHARLLREAGLNLSAVVVRNAERVRAAQTDWPGIDVYSNVADMLSGAISLDLVIIASPTGLHAEHMSAVIDAGVAIVVDKPIATTADSALRLIEAAEAAQVPLTVFQNRRWDPEQLTLKALLRSGTLGPVHKFERRWERWRPEPMSRWKELDTEGGGLLLDLGAHLVDSAVDCFGPVVSVYAELRSLTTPTEDDVFLSLHHAPSPDENSPQVISHLWAGALVGAPGPRTRVLGRTGAFLVTNFESEPTPFAQLDALAAPESLGWLVHGDRTTAVQQAPGGHVDFYRAVVEWLQSDGPVPVNPRDSWHTAMVLDAARRSAESLQREGV